MSDRNWVGVLLILAGWAVLLVPSHETAVQISAFVQKVTGLGALASAFVVVGLVWAMIVLGGVILIWGRR